MRIDYSPPGFIGSIEPVEAQAENRAIIQAVQALNASGKLGDSGELTAAAQCMAVVKLR